MSALKQNSMLLARVSAEKQNNQKAGRGPAFRLFSLVQPKQKCPALHTLSEKSSDHGHGFLEFPLLADTLKFRERSVEPLLHH